MTTAFTYEGAIIPDMANGTFDDSAYLSLSNLGAWHLLGFLGMKPVWAGEIDTDASLAVFQKAAKRRRIKNPEHIVSRMIVLLTAAQRAGCKTVTFG